MKWLTSSLAIAALLAPLACEASEDLTGRVIGITDGDTLTVLVDKHPIKVRLAEIDTPERGQPWSKRAKQALSEKVFGKVVRIAVTGTGHYGRTLGHVHVAERDINREMVREGHAWAFRRYLRDQSLLRDEKHARESFAGLWGHSEVPIAPWEWRSGGKVNQENRSGSRASTADRACGVKRYCREMASCVEANFYLQKCGLSSLDGDGDGVPCEDICLD